MSTKNNNKRFYMGLAVALLLPLSFWVYYNFKVDAAIKNRMPGYYVKDTVISRIENGKTVADTIFHQVGDIQLVNQFGDKVSLNKDLAGKIVLINFFFTDCPTVCPRLTGNIKLLERAFKKNDTTVQLLSISVNPERDSFQVLRKYADRFAVDHDHWWFLTGNKKDIYNFARNELFVTTGLGDGGADDFIHSQKLVLLDKERYIRGYYDGLDSADIKRTADDIVLLSLEKKRKKKH